jgi:hypothetical protein
VVPPGKEAAPQECVGSQTRNRAKLGPGLVKKIAGKEWILCSRGTRGNAQKANLFFTSLL